MIAGGKADALADLADGEATDEERRRLAPWPRPRRLEMAGYVNSRNAIIGALAAFLGLSVLTNLLLLLTK